MRRTKKNAGFAMLIVFLLVGAMAAAGAAVLGLVDNELNIVGRNRELNEATEVAEGGVMEAIDDSNIADKLPSFTTTGLTANYVAPGASPWNDTALKRSYATQMRFMRVAPMQESSQSWSRALIYEIDSIGTMNDGDSTDQVAMEIFRTITIPQGTLLPRIHAK